MNACYDFRKLLEARLTGRPAPARLLELGWHEHLLSCARCRWLLEAEEALEALLSSLPDPALPPHLRARVLARLRLDREEEQLDRLLATDAAASVPPQLAQRVLAAVAPEREALIDARLERLLDLDRADAPAGLAQRTLSRLRLARRPARRVAARWLVVAAAAALVALIAWKTWPVRKPEEPPAVVKELPSGARPQRIAVAPAPGQPDDEMLAALDVLEQWDVLVEGDVDALLSTLPATDAALLEDFREEG